MKVGIDLIEVHRFKKMKKVFLEKVFSKHEQLYCNAFKDSATHYAGTFAAKEAVSKALGVQQYPYIEVEIRRNKAGKPEAFHHGKKLAIAVSISHTKDFATAIAVY